MADRKREGGKGKVDRAPRVPASGPKGPPDPQVDPERGGPQADAGTYIGRLPEHAADTIPGGLTRKDERVSAVDTQTGAKSPEPETPEGHREGEQATDDTIREAGHNE
jgi:hypothetical protein